MYFKTKDYLKAIGKYATIQSYTRCIIPIENEGADP